jgi:hypothetical protein
MFDTIKEKTVEIFKKTIEFLKAANPCKNAWVPTLRLEKWPKGAEKYGKESIFAYPWGITLAITFGQLVFPLRAKSGINRWEQTNCKVFRSYIPVPFFFFTLKSPWGWGGYIGAKPYVIDKDSPRCQWADTEKEDDNMYLCFSASIRRTVDK